MQHAEQKNITVVTNPANGQIGLAVQEMAIQEMSFL